MREAKVDDRIVVAGPDAPDVATCPACDCEVRKRRRRCMDKTVTGTTVTYVGSARSVRSAIDRAAETPRAGRAAVVCRLVAEEYPTKEESSWLRPVRR